MIGVLALSSLFMVVMALFNGFIANQLECMRYKEGCAGRGNRWKGRWHITCGLIRAIFSATLLCIDVRYALTYILIDFTFYNAVLNLARGRSFCRFEGVCEKWGNGFDWDCIWIKIQDAVRAPLVCIKIVILIASLPAIWNL